MAVTRLNYGTTAKVLHWLIVALLAVQLPLGWLMPDVQRGMVPDAATALHVSIGMTILVLIVARFGWRLTHPVAPESQLPPWQRIGAELVHRLLYAAVLLTTISGWLFESARGWTISLFGLVPLPRPVAEGSALGRTLGGWHATLSWILIGLIGIHVAAAFVHLFVYRDRIFHRMLTG
jgi:cytochrome b561